MNVPVACEFSGVVRDAFINKGHNAWSCDLLPTETPGPHLQCDVLEVDRKHSQALRKRWLINGDKTF